MPDSSGDRSDRCDLNHKLANFAFLGTSLSGATFENRDVWITHCGFPAPEFNRVFLKRPGNRTAEAIATAERFFGDVSLPFKFRCRSDRASLCASALIDAGCEHSGETPAMVLRAIAKEPVKPRDEAEQRSEATSRAFKLRRSDDPFTSAWVSKCALPLHGFHATGEAVRQCARVSSKLALKTHPPEREERPR